MVWLEEQQVKVILRKAVHRFLNNSCKLQFSFPNRIAKNQHLSKIKIVLISLEHKWTSIIIIDNHNNNNQIRSKIFHQNPKENLLNKKDSNLLMLDYKYLEQIKKWLGHQVPQKDLLQLTEYLVVVCTQYQLKSNAKKKTNTYLKSH